MLKKSPHFIWLLPVIVASILGILLMLIIDGRMSANSSLHAAVESMQDATNHAIESVQENTAELGEAVQSTAETAAEAAQDLGEAAVDTAETVIESLTNAVTPKREEAETAEAVTTEPTATTSTEVNFDLGTSFTNTLNTSVNAVSAIQTVEEARAAQQSLSDATKQLVSYASVMQFLPLESQTALKDLAVQASESLAIAFEQANAIKGVPAVLAGTQKAFTEALQALE